MDCTRFPSNSDFVPYTGATGDVDLGAHHLSTRQITFTSPNYPNGTGGISVGDEYGDLTIGSPGGVSIWFDADAGWLHLNSGDGIIVYSTLYMNGFAIDSAVVANGLNIGGYWFINDNGSFTFDNGLIQSDGSGNLFSSSLHLGTGSAVIGVYGTNGIIYGTSSAIVLCDVDSGIISLGDIYENNNGTTLIINDNTNTVTVSNQLNVTNLAVAGGCNVTNNLEVGNIISSSDSQKSIDPNSRYLYDSSANIAVKYGNRQLIGPTGGISLDWSGTGTVTSNPAWQINNTFKVTNTLTCKTLNTALSSKSSSYTLVVGTDSTILVTTSGLTMTLPTAVGNTGVEFTIKLTVSGSCTVATTSSQNIDGATTYTLSAQYKYVTVQSNGTQWYIIAAN